MKEHEPIIVGPWAGQLKYGENPYQRAEAEVLKGIELYGSKPSFINWLDFSRAWPNVTEASQALGGKSVAASYKHTSIAGAGYAREFTDSEKKVFTRGKELRNYLDAGNKLSPQANAYLRATWCDRDASFGEMVGLSGILDYSTAVSMSGKRLDGIMCKGFDDEALSMVYRERVIPVAVVTEEYEPPTHIIRVTDIGVRLREDRNTLVYDKKLFQSREQAREGELYGFVVSKNKNIPQDNRDDVILTASSVKYSESNNVGIGLNGCTLNCAGGQKRVLSAQIAAGRWIEFCMLQHPKVLGFKSSKSSLIYAHQERLALIRSMPPEERIDFVRTKFAHSVGVSDAMFPFDDGAKALLDVGVNLIVQPGGSARDQMTIDTVDRHGATMIFARIKKPGSSRWEDDYMARLFAHS